LSDLLAGVSLALCAALGWGTSDFIAGRLSKTMAVVLMLALSQAAGLVFMCCLLGVFRPGLPGPTSALFAAIAGVCTAGALALFYQGMRVGTLSIVAPIAGTAAAVPIVIGVVGGGRPSSFQTAGLVCAIVGVVLASLESGGSSRGRVSAGAVLALLSAVGGGLNLVALSVAGRHNLLWTLTIQRAVAAFLVGLAVVALRAGAGIRRAPLPQVAMVGILDLSGSGFFTAASRYGLLSLVSPVAALFPVVTVILARLFLRETLSRVQSTGVILALAGILLIAT
jgi:drug/metabolite transporter (DMT)-like permease